MTARRSSRLVTPILLALLALGSAAPVLAAPDPGTRMAGETLQTLQDLWAELTGPLVSLFASQDGGTDSPDVPASGSDLDGSEGPEVRPQNGPEIDPNG